MEVTKDNFSELLPLIQASIESADFLAMDFEFTGLLSELNVIHEFDRLEDIYNKLRNHTQHYWACQLGLTCFTYTPAENCYIARPFNFWLFPNNSRKDLSIMPSCVSFLAQSGFDFNKLILQGVPYNKLMAPPVERDITSFYFNSATNDAKVDELLRAVENFIETPQSKLELNVSSLFLRKAFIKQFERRYRGLGYQIMKSRPTILKIVKKGKRPPVIVTTEEVRYRESTVEEPLGVEQVVKMVLLTKKPLIAHNMVYDLFFFYEQFIAELPLTYTEFKLQARQTLPPLYDTKQIPKHFEALQISSTGLLSIMESLNRKRSIDVRLDVEAGFDKYLVEAKNHEAGYDSYITGMAFAKMAHLCRGDHSHESIWVTMQDCAGKVPLISSHYKFLDLYSPESIDAPYFETMLEITTSMKTIELCSELRKYGDVKVIKVGPRQYVARFPRFDDRISSVSEVIDALNMTQVMLAKQFRL